MKGRGAGELVQVGHHLLRTGGVERRQIVGGAALVGDGEQGRPLRRAGAGAAHLIPAAAAGERVINSESRIRIGVVGDVGSGALGRLLRDHARLIRRLRFIRAGAAARTAPAAFARIPVAAVQRQRRAADREHVRRCRGPRSRRAVVARRGDERHARLDEIAVVRRFSREFAAPPAHRHDVRVRRRVVDGRQQVRIRRRTRLDQ